MKKTLVFAIISISLGISPANAITWQEFWEPFTERSEYHRHYYPTCTTRIRREEYVPGNRWRPGYIRVWYDRVPCRRYY